MQVNGVAPVSGAGPMLNVLLDISAPGAGHGRWASGVDGGAMPGLLGRFDGANTSAFEAAKMCANKASTALSFKSGMTPAILPGSGVYASGGLTADSASVVPAAAATAAADHLLLLFLLEHALVIAMLLIMWVIPGEPAVVRDASRQQQTLFAQLLQQQKGAFANAGSKEKGVEYSGERVCSAAGMGSGEHIMKLHANPLYMESAARPSGAHRVCGTE